MWAWVAGLPALASFTCSALLPPGATAALCARACVLRAPTAARAAWLPQPPAARGGVFVETLVSVAGASSAKAGAGAVCAALLVRDCWEGGWEGEHVEPGGGANAWLSVRPSGAAACARRLGLTLHPAPERTPWAWSGSDAPPGAALGACEGACDVACSTPPHAQAGQQVPPPRLPLPPLPRGACPTWVRVLRFARVRMHRMRPCERAQHAGGVRLTASCMT